MCDFSMRFGKCDVRRGVFLRMIGFTLKFPQFNFISSDQLGRFIYRESAPLFRISPCFLFTLILNKIPTFLNVVGKYRTLESYSNCWFSVLDGVLNVRVQ